MVSFELERFEWTPDDRLLVVGRWNGVHGRRIGKPSLTVDTGGRRHRVSGEATGTEADEQWRATFEWDAAQGDVAGAELEVGRSLVVELPAPRRRRRRAAAATPEQEDVAELEALIAGLRTELEAARADDHAAELAELREQLEAARTQGGLNQELAGLRLAHGSLRAAHEQLEDELDALRAVRDERDAAVAEAEGLRSDAADEERIKADLVALIQELQTRAAEAENTRERLTSELAGARAEIERLEQELADTQARVDSERATTTEVHSRLATAREEAQKTMTAEAQETERLRGELEAARESSERALAGERAEVARLREELLDQRSGAQDEDGERREVERVVRDLDRERAATRSLRREVEALRAESAERRRTVSNGTMIAEDRTIRTPEGTQRRVGAARAAATHRVPQRAPSPASLWAVRVGAAVLIALMIVALVFLVTLLP